MLDEISPRGMLRMLSPETIATLRAIAVEERRHSARETLQKRGCTMSESFLVLEGTVGRYIPRPRGGAAQMVALQIVGDFVDLHGFPLGHLDHDVQTVSPVRVAVFRHDDLRVAIAERPEVAKELWSLTMVDAAIHRHWAFRMGALRAVARVANLVCEIDTRLSLCGIDTGEGFDVSLNQIELANACGMTAVHLNRVLRELREDGCFTLRDNRAVILDAERLRQIADFDPSFLYIGGIREPI